MCALRERLKLSRSDLAHRLNVVTLTIANWENSKTAIRPKYCDRLNALALEDVETPEAKKPCGAEER